VLGSGENPRELRDFKMQRGMESRVGLMRVNQTRGVSMGRITDVGLVSPHDILWNHYEDRRVQVTRQDTAALCWPQRGIRARSDTSSEGPLTGLRPHGGRQPDRSWSRHVPRRPVKLHGTWPQDQQPPGRTTNPGTSTETNKTSVRKGTRRSPMQTHETSLVSGATVVGMTSGVCQGQRCLPAGVPGVSMALGKEDRHQPKGRLRQQLAGNSTEES
jgi:hypothetical protein